MNAYDSDQLNEAELRAEHAEEQVRWLKEDLKQANERIKESEERFDRLYDNHRALVAVVERSPEAK